MEQAIALAVRDTRTSDRGCYRGFSFSAAELMQ